MKLNQYLSLSRTFKQDFAKQLGITPAYFSRIVSGKGKPSPKIAKKISELTNGYVTPDEVLYPEDYPETSLEEMFRMMNNKEKLDK